MSTQKPFAPPPDLYEPVDEYGDPIQLDLFDDEDEFTDDEDSDFTDSDILEHGEW